MDVVHGLVFVCLFLIGLCAIAHYFRSSPLPFVSWVVLFGFGYGVLQKTTLTQLPWIHLTPDVILYIFLPVLIFESSRNLVWSAAKAEAIPSVLLATLGIVLSMLVMAVPLAIFSGIPWLDLLFFSAIMSATDPVAVSAVFKKFPVPEKLKMLIEGESLLNDGTTVILFSLLSGRVIQGHPLLFHEGLSEFTVAVIGAVIMGIIGGWACLKIMRHWHALKDHFIAPLMPLLFTYLIFCVVQGGFDFSGVIAVMASTLTMRVAAQRGDRRDLPKACQLEFYRSFWTFLGDLANAILFFMLGAEIGAHTGQFAWKLVVLSVCALLLARSVVVYGFGMLFNRMRYTVPVRWQHVLNLGGLKGALSVALILMIPEEYEYRHAFLCAALVMCTFTLIVNTLALRGYLRNNAAYFAKE